MAKASIEGSPPPWTRRTFLRTGLAGVGGVGLGSWASRRASASGAAGPGTCPMFPVMATIDDAGETVYLYYCLDCTGPPDCGIPDLSKASSLESTSDSLSQGCCGADCIPSTLPPTTFPPGKSLPPFRSRWGLTKAHCTHRFGKGVDAKVGAAGYVTGRRILPGTRTLINTVVKIRNTNTYVWLLACYGSATRSGKVVGGVGYVGKQIGWPAGSVAEEVDAANPEHGKKYVVIRYPAPGVEGGVACFHTLLKKD